MYQHAPLTPRQKQFLEYLKNYISQHEASPSLRQSAEDIGISHTAASSMIKTLETKGWLKREGRYGRTITICSDNSVNVKEEPLHSSMVPIIGRVAAGLPLYAQQEWAGSIALDRTLYRQSSLFALHIRGDSMKNIGILDGDLAICEPRQYADNGEIVVVLIDHEEATVKRFFYRGDHIELVPENELYQPVRYGLGEVLIQGKVVGIHRGPEQMDKL